MATASLYFIGGTALLFCGIALVWAFHGQTSDGLTAGAWLFVALVGLAYTESQVTAGTLIIRLVTEEALAAAKSKVTTLPVHSSEEVKSSENG